MRLNMPPKKKFLPLANPYCSHRSIWSRIVWNPGDFFSDPGAAGLTCAKSGPVKIAADVKANKDPAGRFVVFQMSNEKRDPGCWGVNRGLYGGYTPQLYGDYFINHYKDPY